MRPFLEPARRLADWPRQAPRAAPPHKPDPQPKNLMARTGKTARRPAAQFLFSADEAMQRSAGFQTCCAADFQVGSAACRAAGWETLDTADLEVCDTPDKHAARRENLAHQ